MSLQVNKGVTLSSIVKFLKDFGPETLAEEWDNTGLLVEPQIKKNVQNVLLTNDLTEDVVKEAIDIKADLIISYHPPIFQSLKCITTSKWKERIIGTCIENKIAIYSPHTSWDSVPGGVNDWLASAFDCSNITPIKMCSYMKDAGAGRYGQLEQEITLSKAIENIKSLIEQRYLQIALARGATLDTKIKDVGICAGSGSSVLRNLTAQLYVTGEMSHHELLDAIHNGTSVILCNHSNSERGFLKTFAEKLSIQYRSNDVKTFISVKDRDPLQVV